jgi:hypothetical protein
MGYINPTQHSSSSRAKKTFKLWSSTRISPCTSDVSRFKSLERNLRKTKFPLKTTLDGVVVSIFLLRSRGSRWERCPNWVGWLDDPAETCGLIPCISCMWCWAQSASPSLHSNIFCGLPRVHMGLTCEPCVRSYLCSLTRTSKGLLETGNCWFRNALTYLSKWGGTPSCCCHISCLVSSSFCRKRK